jgi:structural maintenance of chromosome 2
MEYVFGGTFVCSSTEIAKKVAFDHFINKKCKCVNLEGDITDPRGTLSGGYFN